MPDVLELLALSLAETLHQFSMSSTTKVEAFEPLPASPEQTSVRSAKSQPSGSQRSDRSAHSLGAESIGSQNGDTPSKNTPSKNGSQRNSGGSRNGAAPAPAGSPHDTSKASKRSAGSGASASNSATTSIKASVRMGGAAAPSKDSLGAQYRSARGHDFEGGGLHIANGQHVQAKDRNFDAVFDRCRVAISELRESSKGASLCQEAHAELVELIRLIEAMLAHMQELSHDETSKTIVSLKQLCNQIELARDVSAKYHDAPSGCCGPKAPPPRLEAEGTTALRNAYKTVQTYAISLLLEHGFKASDLKHFGEAEYFAAAPAPSSRAPNSSGEPSAVVPGSTQPSGAGLGELSKAMGGAGSGVIA